MTKSRLNRNNIVSIARACVGIKENTSSHDMIIGTYNTYADAHKMYHMTNKDAWCATFVSACFIAGHLSNIIPCECSCSRMVSKAQAMGIWEENDTYIPLIGDIIMYNWSDNGKGDNKGTPNHTGIVESVTYNKITVIEGNKNNEVARRVIDVDSRYIRGYIVPRY